MDVHDFDAPYIVVYANAESINVHDCGDYQIITYVPKEDTK